MKLMWSANKKKNFTILWSKIYVLEIVINCTDKIIQAERTGNGSIMPTDIQTNDKNICNK